MTDFGSAAGRADHLLVVDDDARIRQMLVRYFEGEGFKVSAVPDGAGMRSQLASGSVDLILLDVVLPGGKDGYSLAREVRAGSDLPIIMLTGKDDVTDRVVGLEIGADDYIAKPFHLREVLARVRSVLRRRKTARDYTPPHVANARSAESLAMLTAEHQAVVRALSKLPPRQREVLVLRYYGNLTEAEIAEAAGISRGTVKSTASRALEALQRIMATP